MRTVVKLIERRVKDSVRVSTLGDGRSTRGSLETKVGVFTLVVGQGGNGRSGRDRHVGYPSSGGRRVVKKRRAEGTAAGGQTLSGQPPCCSQHHGEGYICRGNTMKECSDVAAIAGDRERGELNSIDLPERLSSHKGKKLFFLARSSSSSPRQG